MRRTTLTLTLTAMWALAAASAAVGGGCRRAEGSRPLVVFAASSLREVFEAAGAALKRSDAGLDVTFNFAGSQELRAQLEQGAVADLFASADERHMQTLRRSGLVGPPATFARNEPVIVVAAESRQRIRTLEDLPSARRIVLGAADVPIGRYSAVVLERASRRLGADFAARVEARVVSRELNVKQVLAKVALGEADAAIVYRTDAAPVAAAGRVALVPLPPEMAVVADYPLAELTAAPHPGAARVFADFLLSRAGQDLLARHGFLPAHAARASAAERGAAHTRAAETGAADIDGTRGPGSVDGRGNRRFPEPP